MKEDKPVKETEEGWEEPKKSEIVVSWQPQEEGNGRERLGTAECSRDYW